MLCGYPPFDGSEDRRDPDNIWNKILKAQYRFIAEDWDYVSPSAKDLIKNMLCLDIEKRFTAKQVMEHEWFKEVLEETNVKVEGKKLNKNWERFIKQNRLKKQIMIYFVNYYNFDEEK